MRATVVISLILLAGGGSPVYAGDVPEVCAGTSSKLTPEGLMEFMDVTCAAFRDGIHPSPCPSDAFSLNARHWRFGYTGWVDPAGTDLEADLVTAALRTSAGTWDDAVDVALVEDVRAGGLGSRAGERDFVNQIGWRSLGPGTVAFTITWTLPMPEGDGIILESDQVYNSDYAWSFDGARTAFDVQNIATHEFGHTFGMGHPDPHPQNACLTMYARSDLGETQKRTLGEGDVLGIQSLYGTPSG